MLRRAAGEGVRRLRAHGQERPRCAGEQRRTRLVAPGSGRRLRIGRGRIPAACQPVPGAGRGAHGGRVRGIRRSLRRSGGSRHPEDPGRPRSPNPRTSRRAGRPRLGQRRSPRLRARSGRRWRRRWPSSGWSASATPPRDGTTTTRDVEPVLFASTNGRWYLVGWCRLRDAMRWFTVSRIERASVTKTACSGHTVQEVGEPPANARPVHGRDD